MASKKIRHLLRQILHQEFMGDIDAADHTLGSGAQMDIILQCLRSILPLFSGKFKVIFNIDMRNFQNTADIFDIAGYDCLVLIFKGSDFFAGQHRGQCAHHSAADGADDVVQSCSVFLFRFDFIEIFDSAVDTVIYRFVKTLDFGFPGRPVLSGNGTV
jgi:hypothetical protein